MTWKQEDCPITGEKVGYSAYTIVHGSIKTFMKRKKKVQYPLLHKCTMVVLEAMGKDNCCKCGKKIDYDKKDIHATIYPNGKMQIFHYECAMGGVLEDIISAEVGADGRIHTGVHEVKGRKPATSFDIPF